MKTSDFDYYLPSELIAHNPLLKRDMSRLMCVGRGAETIEHRFFYELPEILRFGDVLVFNQSKVVPARILFFVGKREVEIFLLKKVGAVCWQALVRPGRLFKTGNILSIDDRVRVEVEQASDDGTRILKFDYSGSDEELEKHLESLGEPPFPPYLKSSATFEQYQTVYAKEKGSVAAPTAGLHFTDELLERLRDNGVDFEFLTLHVGMGTFAPVKNPEVESHKMHSESFYLPKNVASRLNEAKSAGRRIIAVGTTAVRVLETCAKGALLVACSGETDIFIYPGYEWKFVDGMITNFHLPKSTLLMLVSAFAGRDLVLNAYEEAIKNKYRFYSFGDAMLIL